MIKSCTICLREFYTKNSGQMCCSRECSAKRLQRRVTIVCAKCGKEAQVRRSEISRGRKYCSWDCAQYASSKPITLTAVEIQARFKAKHPDKVLKNLRRSNLRRALRKLNISEDEYYKKLAAQNHVCGICKNLCPTGKNLAIDHDHKTGYFRGLLCTRCNTGLGYFLDDPKLLSMAIAYLGASFGNQYLRKKAA